MQCQIIRKPLPDLHRATSAAAGAGKAQPVCTVDRPDKPRDPVHDSFAPTFARPQKINRSATGWPIHAIANPCVDILLRCISAWLQAYAQNGACIGLGPRIRGDPSAHALRTRVHECCRPVSRSERPASNLQTGNRAGVAYQLASQYHGSAFPASTPNASTPNASTPNASTKGAFASRIVPGGTQRASVGPNLAANAASPAAAPPVSVADWPMAPVSQTSSTGHDHTALILAIAQRRDQNAFAALFAHFGPRVKAWMLRAGASQAAAEELAQETMLTIWQKAAPFRPGSSQPRQPGSSPSPATGGSTHCGGNATPATWCPTRPRNRICPCKPIPPSTLRSRKAAFVPR